MQLYVPDCKPCITQLRQESEHDSAVLGKKQDQGSRLIALSAFTGKKVIQQDMQ